ncbi:MAG: hypothetical protein D6719_11065 [Candidatus Dadabacteria bacterium]|nr:MAG: hypothetical protein D6719_11065 [Candidatus Dadabacteria bacterium]
MRIISLAPFLTELCASYDKADRLVAVTLDCDCPDESIAELPRISISGKGTTPVGRFLGVDDIRLKQIIDLKPDIILSSVRSEDPFYVPVDVKEDLAHSVGPSVKLFNFYPATLEEVYQTLDRVGRALSVAEKGKDLENRLKAQVMAWCDSFYERMKNKKVSFISSIRPLRLASLWIPDMIRLASARSQEIGAREDQQIEWSELVHYQPDVIVVALREKPLNESLAAFKELEHMTGWDAIPAVKRGEVVFASGKGYFYRPTSRLIDSMGILVSAIAGLESGYITERDSFRRLRWAELQRHRI